MAKCIKLVLVLSITILTACNKRVHNLNNQSVGVEAVLSEIVGTWKLHRVRSGWSKKIMPAPVEMELVFKQGGKGEVYESGKLVWIYQLSLTQRSPSAEIRYLINQQESKTSLYFPVDGYLRISDKQLIMGNGDVDGPDLIFVKSKS